MLLGEPGEEPYTVLEFTMCLADDKLSVPKKRKEKKKFPLVELPSSSVRRLADVSTAKGMAKPQDF